MKTLLCLLVLLCGVFLRASAQSEFMFYLQPDGSGTVTWADLEVLEPDAEPAPPRHIFREEYEENASELGEGVSYVSAKPVLTKKHQGLLITYRFKDINKGGSES